MKRSALFSLIILFFVSCSQQKYSFRKTIRVKSKSRETEQPRANVKPEHKPLVPYQEISAKTDDPLNEKQPAENRAELPKEQATASVEKSVTPDIIPEWKKPVEEQKITSPRLTTKTHGDGSGLAIAGFILSILGFFVAGIIFCTLGIIFSALGLQSKNRGLALAGLILGIIGLVLTIMLLMIIL